MHWSSNRGAADSVTSASKPSGSADRDKLLQRLRPAPSPGSGSSDSSQLGHKSLPEPGRTGEQARPPSDPGRKAAHPWIRPSCGAAATLSDRANSLQAQRFARWNAATSVRIGSADPALRRTGSCAASIQGSPPPYAEAHKSLQLQRDLGIPSDARRIAPASPARRIVEMRVTSRKPPPLLRGPRSQRHQKPIVPCSSSAESASCAAGRARGSEPPERRTQRRFSSGRPPRRSAKASAVPAELHASDHASEGSPTARRAARASPPLESTQKLGPGFAALRSGLPEASCAALSFCAARGLFRIAASTYRPCFTGEPAGRTVSRVVPRILCLSANSSRSDAPLYLRPRTAQNTSRGNQQLDHMRRPLARRHCRLDNDHLRPAGIDLSLRQQADDSLIPRPPQPTQAHIATVDTKGMHA